MSAEPSLKNLLLLLADSGVPFVVVGGFAARMHGSTLLTQDIDVCAVLTAENVSKIRTILAPHHPVHRMTPQKLSLLEYPEDLSQINNLYVSTDLGQIDFLGLVGGVGSYADVEKGAVDVSLFGRKCKVIALDDLIKAKKFMGRPHDLVTLQQLEWIKKKLT